MEMASREGGGLLLPTLATEEEAAANLGPFALMRDEYLRSSKPELRADLLAQGALARHLAETEALAEAMADDLAARVAKSRGLDEAAKVADPAAWAAKMAGAAAAAREAAAMKGRVRLEKQRGQEKAKTSRREAGDKPASRRSEAKPPERGQLAFSFDDGANEYPEQLATPLGRLRGNIAAIEALVAVEGRPPARRRRARSARALRGLGRPRRRVRRGIGEMGAREGPAAPAALRRGVRGGARLHAHGVLHPAGDRAPHMGRPSGAWGFRAAGCWSRHAARARSSPPCRRRLRAAASSAWSSTA
ncbi:MAG: TnpV protein [Adlercreutzia equolifaciens]